MACIESPSHNWLGLVLPEWLSACGLRLRAHGDGQQTFSYDFLNRLPGE